MSTFERAILCLCVALWGLNTAMVGIVDYPTWWGGVFAVGNLVTAAIVCRIVWEARGEAVDH